MNEERHRYAIIAIFVPNSNFAILVPNNSRPIDGVDGDDATIVESSSAILVSEHQVQPECVENERSNARRDETAELVSPDQIIRRERRQGKP